MARFTSLPARTAIPSLAVGDYCQSMLDGYPASEHLDGCQLEDISIEEVIGADDPLESLLLQETDVELQDVLAKLPIEQQRVLELRFFAELDLAEIALIS